MRSSRVFAVGTLVFFAVGLVAANHAEAQRLPPQKKRDAHRVCGSCQKGPFFQSSPRPNAPQPNAPTEGAIPKALEITRTGIVFGTVGAMGPVAAEEFPETRIQFLPSPGDPGLVHESSVDPVADLLPVWVEVEVQVGMSVLADIGDTAGAAYQVWVEEDSNSDGAFTCGAGDSCGYLAQNPGFLAVTATDPLWFSFGTSAIGNAYLGQGYPSLRHYFRAARKRHRIRADVICSHLPNTPGPNASSCIFDQGVLKVSSGVAAP